jgi:hypothetical protein
VADFGDAEAGAPEEPSASEFGVDEPAPVPDPEFVRADVEPDSGLDAASAEAAGEQPVATPTEPAVPVSEHRVRRARRVAPRYTPPANEE